MAIQRIRQGLLALFAWARPVDLDAAAHQLPSELMQLFAAMPRREQQHGLEVLTTVRQHGGEHPALLQAALLHDCGKMRFSFTVWEKTLVVLIEAANPELARRWGARPPQGWQRAFAIRQQHPAWGADLVAAHGGDPLLVELVRRHAERLPSSPRDETEHLLIALQAADDAN